MHHRPVGHVAWDLLLLSLVSFSVNIDMHSSFGIHVQYLCPEKLLHGVRYFALHLLKARCNRLYCSHASFKNNEI